MSVFFVQLLDSNTRIPLVIREVLVLAISDDRPKKIWMSRNTYSCLKRWIWVSKTTLCQAILYLRGLSWDIEDSHYILIIQSNIEESLEYDLRYLAIIFCVPTAKNIFQLHPYNCWTWTFLSQLTLVTFWGQKIHSY